MNHFSPEDIRYLQLLPLKKVEFPSERFNQHCFPSIYIPNYDLVRSISLEQAGLSTTTSIKNSRTKSCRFRQHLQLLQLKNNHNRNGKIDKINISGSKETLADIILKQSFPYIICTYNLGSTFLFRP